MSYIVTLGHEIILGHHLSHETECYHHNSCGTEDHKDEGEQLPCLLDLSPHFISTTLVLRSDFDDEELVYSGFLFNTKLNAEEFRNDCLHSPECQTDYKLPLSPGTRSHRLRGPPAA